MVRYVKDFHEISIQQVEELVSGGNPFENQKFMNSSFYLNLNGSQKQAGSPKDLIFGLEKLIEYISSIFTIQKGDLLFTGTPSGVGPVKIGDKLEGYLDDIKVLHCDIK